MLPQEFLPDSMQDLARYIGMPATLKIIELRGGRVLHVPVKASEQHWLVPHIGIDALRALVSIYTDETIEIPRCAGAIQALKEQAIMDDAKTMYTPALAARYGYTIRGIRKLRRRCEVDQQARKNQAKLFD